MIEKSIILDSPGGVHLKPAGAVNEKALEFRCRSELIMGDKSYNLKSVLSVLSFQATGKDEAVLRCEGCDEKDALMALAGLLEGSADDQMKE